MLRRSVRPGAHITPRATPRGYGALAPCTAEGSRTPTTDPAVDVHLHLSRWWPAIGTTGYRPDLDYSVTGLLAELDHAGIGGGLLIPVHEAPSAEEALVEVCDLAGRSHGRLRPVATVDPTRGEAEIAAAVRRWSATPQIAAIKLFPGYLPFYPHDRRLEPVYAFAAERGLPVMLHQGDTLDPSGRIKYARPIEVDEVAVAHRDVRFVLCHLGNPWIEEAAELVYKNPNVYADTSGLLAHPRSPYFARMVERCRTVLQAAIDTIGSADRLLYGSDWPLEELRTARGLIDALEISAADRSAILGGTARTLYRLGPAGDS